jgi:hypothetical protein
MAEFITAIRTTEGDKKYDYNALGNLPTGLDGRGKLIDYTQIDAATENGWYAFYTQGTTIGGLTFQYAHLRVDAFDEMSCRQTMYLVHSSGAVLTRKCSFNGVWGEWEWVNPPMVAGVEYRTTERYKGVAVYKKVDNDGNILWRGENETSWHLLASSGAVAAATIE